MKMLLGSALLGVGAGVIVGGGVEVIPIFACVSVSVGLTLMFWE